ncbi:uncharacterized protein P174DRAFT_223247 [Aspergillus novofumigatus IBT 16806]|uniref:Uncharacterized protein n=1 Tax=Aspergillus novofumigatus (strain IBT 16806) TaxID=1392255 RepID=A0A2I1C698_ASPN1|nr:uncharacterized protein P174DRAFT_223247 [Aspergillus novofumigatus IBT 16806]PKX93160.1 hypothetical protein P174DRAFT_223247 [Aspergillus novofumigatus IBT 16806]
MTYSIRTLSIIQGLDAVRCRGWHLAVLFRIFNRESITKDLLTVLRTEILIIVLKVQPISVLRLIAIIQWIVMWHRATVTPSQMFSKHDLRTTHGCFIPSRWGALSLALLDPFCLFQIPSPDDDSLKNATVLHLADATLFRPTLSWINPVSTEYAL